MADSSIRRNSDSLLPFSVWAFGWAEGAALPWAADGPLCALAASAFGPWKSERRVGFLGGRSGGRGGGSSWAGGGREGGLGGSLWRGGKGARSDAGRIPSRRPLLGGARLELQQTTLH